MLPGADLLWLYGPGILCSFLPARALVVGFLSQKQPREALKEAFVLFGGISEWRPAKKEGERALWAKGGSAGICAFKASSRCLGEAGSGAWLPGRAAGAGSSPQVRG